jgi:hypothetical protein
MQQYPEVVLSVRVPGGSRTAPQLLGLGQRVDVSALMQERTQVELRITVAGLGGLAPQLFGGGVFTAVMAGHAAFIQRGGVADSGVRGDLGHLCFPSGGDPRGLRHTPLFETIYLEL